jgi:osmotically-inducible protein OsmY
MTRAPSYQTTLGFTPAPLPASKLQAEATQVLARSSVLPSGASIQVSVENTGSNQVVVLRGEVSNATERRLAESLVRVTRGVHDVRNDLVVRPPSPVRAGQ